MDLDQPEVVLAPKLGQMATLCPQDHDPLIPHREEPHTNFDDEILVRGLPKHGWHWVRDTQGYLWGAKRRDGILHKLLQVEDKPPEFPTVEWTRQTQVAEWSCQGRSWPVSYYL